MKMTDWNFWLRALRSPEGAEGGGTGDGSSGTEPGTVTGEGEAQAEPPVDTTFLSEAAAKAKEGEAPEGEAKAEGEAKVEGEAPAAFELSSLTIPEGFEIDEETGKVFTDLINDAALTPQERAQKFMDLHTQALQQSIEAQTAAIAQSVRDSNMEVWKKQNETWRSQIAALPEFKENPDAEAGKVMQALATLGADKEFFKALDITGAGNHPAILQIFHRLAKPFMEGEAVTGDGGQQKKREPGANIYTSATQP